MYKMCICMFMCTHSTQCKERSENDDLEYYEHVLLDAKHHAL